MKEDWRDRAIWLPSLFKGEEADLTINFHVCVGKSHKVSEACHALLGVQTDP